MEKIQKNIFPNGSPEYSISDMHNKYVKACAEICSVSLVQDGPFPKFLSPETFELLRQTKSTAADYKENFLDQNDFTVIKKIKENPMEHTDYIIENGYNGPINESKIDAIIGTVKS